MSLDMADRMVVMGISAKSMTARAVTDSKNNSHLSSALTQETRTKQRLPSLPAPPHPQSLGLDLEALNFSAGST